MTRFTIHRPAPVALDRSGFVLRTAVVTTLVLLYAGSGLAEVFAPSSVVTTSEWDGPAPNAKKINLIDGSGLSGVGPVEGQTHDDSANATTMWHAGQLDGGLGGPTGAPPVVATQAVVFDIGELRDLDGAYVWNHNQSGSTARGVDGFEILVSSDSNPITASFTSLGNFNIAQASSTAEPSQLASFSAAAVRLVKFQILSAHSGATNDWVGLSEVRFVGPTVPPLPPLFLLEGALVVGASPPLENVGGTLRIVEPELHAIGRTVVVPEPGLLWSLGSGLVLLGALSNRRERHACRRQQRHEPNPCASSNAPGEKRH